MGRVTVTAYIGVSLTHWSRPPRYVAYGMRLHAKGQVREYWEVLQDASPKDMEMFAVLRVLSAAEAHAKDMFFKFITNSGALSQNIENAAKRKRNIQKGKKYRRDLNFQSDWFAASVLWDAVKKGAREPHGAAQENEIKLAHMLALSKTRLPDKLSRTHLIDKHDIIF